MLRAALVPTMIAALALLLVSSAAAADKYRYDVAIKPAAFAGTPAGSVAIRGLNTGLTTTARVLRLGVQQYSGVGAAGGESISFSAFSIQPGDQIEVQQPTGSVQETYTVPNISITGTAGSPVVNGSVPPGSIANVFWDQVCNGFADDDFPAAVSGDTFTATLPEPVYAGARLNVTAYPGKGDILRYDTRPPGETPCLSASAVHFPESPGEALVPDPFTINATQLRPTVTTGARLVLRRAGAAVVDFTNAAATSSISDQIAVQPLAGDVLELYRPHTAPAPTYTFTVPSIRAIYDPSNALAAVDAPAANAILVGVESYFSKGSNFRSAMHTAAGRTIFNFGVPEGFAQAINLKMPVSVTTTWYSADKRNEYDLATTPGDLTPPALSVKLGKKFTATKIGSSIPATITSSEAASGKVTLTLPAKLKTAKAKSPQLLASAKVSLKAGSNKVKIKLSKSGKKLLKRLKKGHFATQRMTLTLSVADASGNAATTTKTTKLAPK
jgi:hypothetical protein